MQVSTAGRESKPEGSEAMETTTFIKPRFAIGALPGTGVMLVQVKAATEKPATRVVLQTPAVSSLS
jgi:hypothetical protein